MAKKGQKFNKYTVELRSEVLEKYFTGQYSARTLGDEYGISPKTIGTWIKAYKDGKSLGMAKRGKRKADDTIDYKERYEILKKFQAFVEAQRKRK